MLDNIEDLLRNYVLEKQISGCCADLFLLNAHCRERMMKLRVFRECLHFPGFLIKKLSAP
jgi:hypothetical protein